MSSLHYGVSFQDVFTFTRYDTLTPSAAAALLPLSDVTRKHYPVARKTIRSVARCLVELQVARYRGHHLLAGVRGSMTAEQMDVRRMSGHFAR